MELNRAVAENIKRIRKSKKLSLERTAALSGVSRSMLSQIERGEANPSVAILGKLAEALKVPAEVLLENDDFTSLLVARELDNTPERLDNGKVLRRISFPTTTGPVRRVFSGSVHQRPLPAGAVGTRLCVSRYRYVRHGEPDSRGRDVSADGEGRPAVCGGPAL